MIVSIPVSIGELVDKITILIIKEQYAQNAQLNNIKKELQLLTSSLDDLGVAGHPAFEPLIQHLTEVNAKLWQLEDAVRVKLRGNSYDQEFIDIAKNIHHTNDERSRIKRQINEIFNSEIIEEKIY